MRKKLFSIILCAILVFSIAVPAFATTNNYQGHSDANYYIVTADGIMPVTLSQREEILNQNIEASVVAQRDGIEITPANPVAVATSFTEMISAKATGYWQITSNTISSGGTTYYWGTPSSWLSVASDEYINMTISKTNPESFFVGYTGTSEGLYYVSTGGTQTTAVIDFIDALKVPGSYRTLITNDNKTSLTVWGSLSVSKR